jgi:hypothetical protein
MLVELTTTTLVAAAPPMVTPVAPVKPVPVIVTGVPPAVEPEVGEMDVTVGGDAVGEQVAEKMTVPVPENASTSIWTKAPGNVIDADDGPPDPVWFCKIKTLVLDPLLYLYEKSIVAVPVVE